MVSTQRSQKGVVVPVYITWTKIGGQILTFNECAHSHIRARTHTKPLSLSSETWGHISWGVRPQSSAYFSLKPVLLLRAWSVYTYGFSTLQSTLVWAVGYETSLMSLGLDTCFKMRERRTCILVLLIVTTNNMKEKSQNKLLFDSIPV